MSHPISTDYKNDELVIARYAKALGHPARVAILNHLAAMSNCCFTDILNELPIAQATVSQHLKELKESGLVQGNVEPPKVKYCINKKNWENAKLLFNQFFEKKVNGC